MERPILARACCQGLLAAPWQATISHKWPVSPIPAAALGALFANKIALGNSFFDAYKGVVEDMIRATDSVDVTDRIDSAAGMRTELAERVRRSSQNFAAFERYASASFFE
jgi:hypothetical protein